VVLGLSVLVTGGTARPALLVGGVGLVVALIVGGSTAPRLAQLDTDDPPLTPAVIGAIGVVGGVLVLSSPLAGDPQRYTVVFGVVIVAAAFALPGRQRRPLIVLALLGWAAALWFGGVRDATALFTQLGGAVLLALVALRTTASLEAALAVERAASRASRTRASLLGSVLRLQSLEPADVAEGVVRGVREAGFDSAILRLVDGDDLRLVAARPLPGQDLELRLPPATGIAGVARRTGRPVVVHDYQRHPALLPSAGELRGAIAVPVRVDDELAGVLLGGRRAPGLQPDHIQAVELLAEATGAALRRARRFAADTATVQELRRLDERTHDFVSTVSHELRTPMTVIDGLGQTLERRWDDLAGTRRADLLRRIDENAERLAVMIRSLVDSSALERGHLVAAIEPVHLAACTAAVLDRSSPLLEAHRTEVDVPDTLHVQADPGLLEHVLENLLSNAARHTPAGTTVVVRARRDDDEVEVEVADDGPGIAAEDLPHILERFYRAGEPTTRPSGGLGLGLALSQQVLQAHGRGLTVASEPGEGTRFSFRLPVADRSAEVTAPGR
jgi:signal transduction histidine kinase